MRQILAALFLLSAAPLAAKAAIDDSDLGGNRVRAQEAAARLAEESRPEKGLLLFGTRGAGPGTPRPQTGVAGCFLLPARGGASLPARLGRARLVGKGASAAWASLADDGSFFFATPEKPSGTYRVRFSLDNALWRFRGDKDASYEWESPAFGLAAGLGKDLGCVQPAEGSENGRLGLLHLAYLDARDLLSRAGDLAWWSEPLTVKIPSDGNYFQPWAWSVHLTDAGAWDVNLHELGHAVMERSMNAESAGGQHYIDRCYSEALAWSEGWASYFAAAVRVPLSDPDAKFEFLVPRRAPIRLENVPDEVCAGPTSEWRVAAGLWDLLDTHKDGGDDYAASFSRLWRAWRGQRLGGMTSAWALLRDGLPPEEAKAAEAALVHNTLLPARPALMAGVSLPAPAWDSAP